MRQVKFWLPVLLLLGTSLAGCIFDDDEETNRPPVAVIQSPQQGATIEIGDNVFLDATGSSDPDGNALRYIWVSNIEGDIGGATPEEQVNPIQIHVFTKPGHHVITLNVFDTGGLTDDTVRQVIVVYPNRAPTAGIIEPADGGEYSVANEISFSHGSSDPDEGDTTLLSILWTLDGNVVSVDHSFVREVAEGDHVIELRVEDPGGLSDTVEHAFSVTNLPPTAVINVDKASGYAGEEFAFSAADSSDPEGDGLTYAWEFGDNTTSGEEEPTHIWHAVGTYKVNLTVTDQHEYSDTASLYIDIERGTPTAVFEFRAGDEVVNAPRVGDALTLDAGNSSVPTGALVNYTWDFGDGNTDETNDTTIDHTWNSGGWYDVNLTVWDENNETDDTTQQLRVIPDDYHDEHSDGISLGPSGSTEDDYPFPVEIFMETIELDLTINSDWGDFDYTFEVRDSEDNLLWTADGTVNGGGSENEQITLNPIDTGGVTGNYVIHLEIDGVGIGGTSANWDYIIDVIYA